MQLTPRYTAALVAAVHALARREAEGDPPAGPPAEVLDEASFRAGRAGFAAILPAGDLLVAAGPVTPERSAR